MAPFTIVVQEEVLRALLGLRQHERNKVVQYFERIASNPYIAPDFSDESTYPRPLYVKRFGSWKVVYWADHVSKELRIVDLRP